jgi:hypothetical protein
MEEVFSDDIPVIPFNGLFLSDLVFNFERNSNDSVSSSDQVSLCVNMQHKLIPYYKNHVAAKIVRYFLSFQSARHRFDKVLSGRERQLYSYFADIGRLGGEFQM